MRTRPFLVNGDWRTGEGTFEVRSPFDDSVVSEIGVPTDTDVEEATATAATPSAPTTSNARPSKRPSAACCRS